jgi:hypothetical protein
MSGRRFTTEPTQPVRRQGSRLVSMWFGCDLMTWLRLIAPNWRRLDPSRRGALLISCLVSVANSLLHAIQAVVFALPLRWTKPVRGPLFIIGHWRSGTTVLHHLLALDQRFTYPNNYVCFCPHHFLLTEWLLREGFDSLAPLTRPMDDLPLESGGPQEDEFALMNLGAPSPYCAIAFPDRGLDLADRLDREATDPRLTRRWQRKMDWLVRALTFRERKRLVLKSPTHTFRVRRLLAMYPDAQFVHIVRDPLATIASTLAMWKALCGTQALGSWDQSRLEDSVLDNYRAMCRTFAAVRRDLKPSQLHEIHYERLLEDPLGEMKSLYAALELGEFDYARPEVLRHLQSVKTHRPSVHPFSERMGSFVLRL